MFEQVSGIASRDHRLRLGVGEPAGAGDSEAAGQILGHDHHRRAEAIAQLEDEVVQQLGADGVQARRRLVEEEDVGVERHGPGQAGALAHAAADLRGIELLEASQADQRELQRDELGDLRRREPRVLAERETDVLGQRQRAPERAALVQHPEAAHDPLARLRLRRPEAFAVVEDAAAGGVDEADQVPEQRALAATATAHDHEDLAGPHREVQVALDDARAVPHVEVAHRDAGVRDAHGRVPVSSTTLPARSTRNLNVCPAVIVPSFSRIFVMSSAAWRVMPGLTMPTTAPAMVNMGPPELPVLIVAFVWKNSASGMARYTVLGGHLALIHPTLSEYESP